MLERSHEKRPQFRLDNNAGNGGDRDLRRETSVLGAGGTAHVFYRRWQQHAHLLPQTQQRTRKAKTWPVRKASVIAWVTPPGPQATDMGQTQTRTSEDSVWTECCVPLRLEVGGLSFHKLSGSGFNER